MIYQNLPFIPSGIQGYFLYKKGELQELTEPWMVSRVFVDPTAQDPEEVIDVSDAAVVLPSDVEKLTIPVTHHLNTMEELLKYCPDIIDCLNLENK